MSRPETPANVTRSVAGRLMSMDWSTGVASSEAPSPTARPTSGHQHSLPDDQPAHVRSMRAKGHPDADFPRAHAHSVGDYPVEPEARERQRHEPKQHGDFGREADRAQLAEPRGPCPSGPRRLA